MCLSQRPKHITKTIEGIVMKKWKQTITYSIANFISDALMVFLPA